MGREGRDYWVVQLAEYWESGLTIQEYSELKELPTKVHGVGSGMIQKNESPA